MNAFLERYQLRFLSRSLWGLLGVCALCAWHDIATENCDMMTLSSARGHRNVYFTWWWCDQVPK